MNPAAGENKPKESNGCVLVLDDEECIRETLTHLLLDAGYDAHAVADGAGALELAGDLDFSVAIVDLNLGSDYGMDVIRKLKAVSPDTEIIVYTGTATVESAVDAVHEHVFAFLQKPEGATQIRRTVGRALERRALMLENRTLMARLRQENEDLQKEAESAKRALAEQQELSHMLIGASESISQIRRVISDVAKTDMTILIRGESGTGKEVVARLLHKLSGRKGQFVKVNCGALPGGLLESEMFGHEQGAFTGAVRAKPGRFELAVNGTVFLDEIGTLEPPMQAALLQVIEHNQFVRLGGSGNVQVNGRILAATNAPLEEFMAAGRFRQDIYYRLRQFTITLPPLRDRIEDIPVLLRYFMEDLCRKLDRPELTFPESVMPHLLKHTWPGNVRELKALAGQLAIRNRPEEIEEIIASEFRPKHGNGKHENLRSTEIRTILSALAASKWNRKRAADSLGLSYSSLRRRIGKYKLGQYQLHFDGESVPDHGEDE